MKTFINVTTISKLVKLNVFYLRMVMEVDEKFYQNFMQ